VRDRRGRGPVLDPQLLVDVLKVLLHGPERHPQDAGDPLVALSRRGPCQDLGLPSADPQVRQRFGRQMSAPLLEEQQPTSIACQPAHDQAILTAADDERRGRRRRPDVRERGLLVEPGPDSLRKHVPPARVVAEIRVEQPPRLGGRLADRAVVQHLYHPAIKLFQRAAEQIFSRSSAAR